MVEDQASDELDARITSICRLPLDFRGNVTISELLSRAGYRHSDRLKPELIVPTLRDHPEWTDAWFDWSDDKRTSGWYVHELDDHFVVGSYPPTSQRPTLHLTDRTEAAAEFIVRELDDVSTSLLSALREWLLRKLRPT